MDEILSYMVFCLRATGFLALTFIPGAILWLVISVSLTILESRKRPIA